VNERNIAMKNSTTSSSSFSRRTVLRTGGTVAAATVFLAACGKSTPASLARIGDAPSTTKPTDGPITDILLLRTAMSMEQMVHDALTNAVVSKNVAAENQAIIASYAAIHKSHMTTLGSLVSARGGQAYQDANPKLSASAIAPALALIKDSDQKPVDALALTLAVETLLASTYQYFVSLIHESALRADLMKIGIRASQNAAITAQLIRGGTKAFAPATDDAGVALVATLPDAFGSLSSVQVTLGKPNDTGNRGVLIFDTPSLNSFIY